MASVGPSHAGFTPGSDQSGSGRVEQMSDEIPAAADAGLVEDGLEVVLDGVPRDMQRVGDGVRSVAAQHEPGDIGFAAYP